MPRIDILEDDLTRVSSTLGSDIPYIPGFAFKTSESIVDTPVLCTSVLQFEKLFGTQPVIFYDEAAIPEVGIAKYSFDRSYVMAKELLSLGMPVYYHAIDFSPADSKTYNFAEVHFHQLLSKKLSPANISGLDIADKNEFSIKYLTSGGYPNFKVDDNNLADIMLDIAQRRGDCVALIEGKLSYTTLDPTGESFYAELLAHPFEIPVDENTNRKLDPSFGAAFATWGTYALRNAYKVKDSNGRDIKISKAELPGCFGYLATLASNIKSSPNWLAMAGTARGLVPNLLSLTVPTNQTLNNAVANAYQPTKATTLEGTLALNAITNINPYGLCIWGNRTLKRITEEYPLAGTGFLNIRNMISDIKKVAYRVAKSLIYEQNNDVLWLNFKSQVTPFLEQLKSGNGLNDYKLIKLDHHYDGSKLNKEEFACAIKVYPVYAVEAFEITVVVTDAEVAVESVKEA